MKDSIKVRVRAFYIKADGSAETAYNESFKDKASAETSFNEFIRKHSGGANVFRASSTHTYVVYENGDKYDIELDVFK